MCVLFIWFNFQFLCVVVAVSHFIHFGVDWLIIFCALLPMLLHISTHRIRIKATKKQQNCCVVCFFFFFCSRFSFYQRDDAKKNTNNEKLPKKEKKIKHTHWITHWITRTFLLRLFFSLQFSFKSRWFLFSTLLFASSSNTKNEKFFSSVLVCSHPNNFNRFYKYLLINCSV